MAIVAYKNKNTDEVVAYAEPQPRLEALGEWERCDTSEVSYTVADAHDRAAAERASIEAAAALRLDSAAGSAIAGVAAASAYNTNAAAGDGTIAGPLPTLSTGTAGEQQQRVPVLAKDDALRDNNATPFEVNKQLADQEIASPPSDGVLKRAKRDHKTGATQIGANPEEHATVKAAKGATAAQAKAAETKAGEVTARAVS